ncbi:tRNA (adenosine(37)-N6)-dimethylallyltransferase MiaA [Arhodomonas sp. SL1]|uniref:tRNA (adenosine(37)-N6)-dimethylallyltransferase MiaA n=1 Tax=Arhodomonas sp. SL1 TaxID=3425691 RepID=UPI003F880C10
MTAQRLPVVLLMGPTASGKTAAAIELVEHFPVEVVSVDSAQVYRGMDIGTAKPGPEELARAPHRLIDILDPAERYSAARFREDALAEIAAIHRAGRVPLLAGGTMLYFRALSRGLADLPDADPVVRAEIEEEARHHGWAVLHQRLAGLDPQTAARLHPNDAQRIQRALEVYRLTGQSLSALTAAARTEPFPFRLVTWAVAPAERRVLHERIGRRFAAMLRDGFIDEVAALRRRGDLHTGLPSMRAVGYRQVWEYLEGRFDREDLEQRGVAATRQFAKRQLTWLRRERDAQWFDAADGRLLRQLRDAMGRVLDSR